MHTELTELNPHSQYAIATYHVDSNKYSEKIADEIAIGQSLGAWDTKFVDASVLKTKVAKVVSLKKESDFYIIEIAFPFELWDGNISFLLVLLFGKLSFYPGVQLNSVTFSHACFLNENLKGPKHTVQSLRDMTGAPDNSPLLMGILKPNVALNPEQIASLCLNAAEAGVHLVKDDEIRFDEDEDEIIKRVERVYNAFEKHNLKTVYAVHLQVANSHYLSLAKRLEEAGAKSFLLNTYVTGVGVLQELRNATNCVIMSHPAFAGSFSTKSTSPVHPRVTYAQILRACGADLTLFPSPYGKIGLEKEITLDIAKHCLLKNNDWPINQIIPVPSAGIKPEHALLAKEDFGNDFILNAGTAIFGTEKSIENNILEFKKSLYSEEYFNYQEKKCTTHTRN